MRTTLTIDDDVAFKLNELQKTADKSFKQIVNETLRKGLFDEAKVMKIKPFKVDAMEMGKVRDGFNLDKISSVLDSLDELEGR